MTYPKRCLDCGQLNNSIQDEVTHGGYCTGLRSEYYNRILARGTNCIVFLDWYLTLSDIDLQVWDKECPVRKKTSKELYADFVNSRIHTQAGGV